MKYECLRLCRSKSLRWPSVTVGSAWNCCCCRSVSLASSSRRWLLSEHWWDWRSLRYFRYGRLDRRSHWSGTFSARRIGVCDVEVHMPWFFLSGFWYAVCLSFVARLLFWHWICSKSTNLVHVPLVRSTVVVDFVMQDS